MCFCKIPESGGATTFTKADVFVRPQAGMATFFSYKVRGANYFFNAFCCGHVCFRMSHNKCVCVRRVRMDGWMTDILSIVVALCCRARKSSLQSG